ncbi:MAG: PilZ domain-containing protein [Candidatus Aureabacteria bacterium]|nr:PilZ domain-containing protein [Candidatus Auribacterota bacterium]
MQKTISVDGVNMVDRRIKPRTAVTYMAEAYMGSEILFATTVDVSTDGFGITFRDEFSVGEILDLRINYRLCDGLDSDFERLNICLKAEIVWIEKNEKTYRGGIKIIEIDQNDFDILKKSIERIDK